MLQLVHFHFLALLPGDHSVSPSLSHGGHSFHFGGNVITNDFI